MKIKVRAFAYFREILGLEIDVEIPPASTAGDLLEALSSRPGFREAAFDEGGHLKDYVRLMRNRLPLSTLDTTLEDGDEIAIFPPVAGG